MMANCFRKDVSVVNTSRAFCSVTRNTMTLPKYCNSYSNKMLTTNCYFLTAYMYIINNSYLKLSDGSDHKACKNIIHPHFSIILWNKIAFQLQVVIAVVLQVLPKDSIPIPENIFGQPELPSNFVTTIKYYLHDSIVTARKCQS